LNPGETSVRPRKKKWARDVLGLVGTKAVLFPLGLVTGILVTRELGPTNRGVFAFVTLLIGFVGPLLQFGFGNGVRYYVSVGEFCPRDTAFSAFLTRLGLGVLTSAGLAVLFHFHALGATADLLTRPQLVPVLVVLPLVGAGTVLRWILVGDSRFNVVNPIDIAGSLLLVGLLFTTVVVGDMGLNGAIWSLLTAQALGALITILAVLLIYKPLLRFDVRSIGMSFSYGIRMWIGSIATRSNDRLDQFVLAVAASANQLGQYSVAVRVAELPLMLGSVSAPVVFNRVAAAADSDERVRIIDQLHRAHFALVGAVIVVVGLVGYFLIPLVYGEAFEAAALPFLLYLPGVLAYSSRQVIDKFFSGSGRPFWASILQIVGLGVGLPLYLYLIPKYGAVGASVASSLVYSASAFAGLLAYHHFAGPKKANPFAISRQDLKWASQQMKSGLTDWKRGYRGFWR